MTLTDLARGVQPGGDPCPRHSRLDALLVRVGGGDRAALAAIYDETSHTVYGMSLSSGRGSAMAAQLTLDVFLRAWEQAGTYDPETESAWTWVRAIALETINSP